jgi:4-hydroxy-2-oxoheptanedioate aldolase
MRPVGHCEVQRAISQGIVTVRAAGKAPGVLSADVKLARQYLDAGALFVAVGVDTTLLVRAATELAGSFKGQATRVPGASASSVY